MKKQWINTYLLFALLVINLFLWPSLGQAGPFSDYNIICGDENKCELSTHSCIQCHYKETHYLTSFWGLGNTSTEWDEYHCVTKGVTSALSKRSDNGTHAGNSPTSACSDTSTGGISGDIQDNSFFGSNKTITEEGYNCVTTNLRNMYGSICYSCIIIARLISAFTTAGATAYDISRTLANVILMIATVLWLSMYVLKSISAFTTVEPMKMLNDIFMQLFKVLVAYVIVNSGIATIVHYTVEPLMNTGLDFASAILRTLGGHIQ